MYSFFARMGHPDIIIIIIIIILLYSQECNATYNVRGIAINQEMNIKQLSCGHKKTEPDWNGDSRTKGFYT
jgi:hypothetical protein